MEIGKYSRLVDLAPLKGIGAIEAGSLPGKIIEKDPYGKKEGFVSQIHEMFRKSDSETGRKEARVIVELRDSDMLAIPGVVPSLMAFMSCLRCGFDPRICPDARIASAISLVPGNLKDLNHARVLAVARRVADALGRMDETKRPGESGDVGDSRKGDGHAAGEAPHKGQMEGLHQKMREHREVLSPLHGVLQRMNETEHLPEGLRDNMPPIRKTPPRIIRRQVDPRKTSRRAISEPG